MKRIILPMALALAGASALWGAAPQRLSPRAAMAAETATADAQQQMLATYLTIDPASLDREALEGLGVKITLEAGDLATARVPREALAAIADVEGIIYVQTASAASQMLDVATAETGGAAVRSGAGLDHPFTGEGVVVGIVDAGFDYGHAAFRDTDGALRIKRVWEQGTTTGSAPERFGYGTEFTNSDEILTAAGDIRNNSHGTHVTAIAAGSDLCLDGALQGFAPEADIVLVSYNGAGADNVNISNAIAYIFDYADAVGMPCVVNLSLGAHDGPHDGTSAFDVLADRLSGPGRLIVGAAGNNRADKFHLSRTFSDENDDPLRSFVNFLNSDYATEIDIWASAPESVEVAVMATNTGTSDVVERVVIYPAEGATDVSLGRNISGSLRAVAETSPLNGKAHIFLTSDIRSIRTGYAVAIEVKPLGATTVDLWTEGATSAFSANGLEGYEEPGAASTICEIGGTSRSILTVGAYTTRSEYCLYNEETPRHLNETDGDISSFSSYGPTADGRMKPQVAAPGAFISSAISNYDAAAAALLSYVHSDSERDYRYGYMQGTSMATPAVTGIVATWLQAYPTLSPAELEEVVRATARTDAFTGELPDGSNDWGWGKIDALAGIRECLTMAGGGVEGVMAAPARVLASVRGSDLALAFASSVKAAKVNIYNPAGVLILHRDLGAVAAGEERLLPLADLQRGLYIVAVDTPRGVETFKVNR